MENKSCLTLQMPQKNMQNRKSEYKEYLALMQKAEDIAKQWLIEKDASKRDEAIDKIGDIFDEIERKFLGPRSTPSANHYLRHDYDFDNPSIKLSFEDFVEGRKEYEEADYASIYNRK